MDEHNKSGHIMNNFTLNSAIKRVFDNRILDLHTSMPAKIVEYNKDKCNATVKPVLKKKFFDGDELEIQVITNVPIVFPRTNRGSISFPLEKDDGVLLVFSERAMEYWLNKGEITIPGDRRKFDLTDAIAIPGLFPFSTSTKIQSDNNFEIHFNNASIIINSNNKVDINNGNLTVEL